MEAVNVDGHLVLRESVLTAGEEWPFENRCWRFLRLVHGDAYWVSAGETRSISAGDLLIVPGHVNGSVRASQISGATFHYFKMCPEALQGFLSLDERHGLERPGLAVRTLGGAHPLALRFRALSEAIDAPNGLLRRCQMLQIMAEALASEVAAKETRRFQPIFARERFQYLATQFTEAELLRCSMEDLAGFCNCTERHFQMLFRRRFGVSLRARQQDLYLCEAAERLATTRDNIDMIARDFGYQLRRSFEIAFKKRFRTTPFQWRQRAAQQYNGKAEDFLTEM